MRNHQKFLTLAFTPTANYTYENRPAHIASKEIMMMLARRLSWHGPVSRARRGNKTQLIRFGLVPLISLLLVMLAACGGSSSPPGYTVSAIDSTSSPQVLYTPVAPRAILRV